VSLRLAIGAGLALWLAAAPAQGCGGRGVACVLDGGDYHAAAPVGAPLGAVPFLHRYGGSGAGAIADTALVEAVTGRGFVLVASSGLPIGGAGPVAAGTRSAIRPGATTPGSCARWRPMRRAASAYRPTGCSPPGSLAAA
jgi:hypothetical protein